MSTKEELIKQLEDSKSSVVWVDRQDLLDVLADRAYEFIPRPPSSEAVNREKLLNRLKNFQN